MINLVILSPAHVHTKGCIESIAKRTDCKVAAVWDDVADRGKRYADSCGAKFLTDLKAAVNFPGVDGFIVFAENTRHLPLLRAAIPAGKPIFCEKPFAATVADVTEAMQLVRKHGTIVHMGYTQPFQASIRGAAKLIADGVIGKVTHVRCRNAHDAAYGRWFDSPDVAWFTDPALAGGGAFMDMGTHAVHVLRSLFGPVTRVLARIANVSGVYPRVDDTGIALLQFSGGQLGTVEASWVQTGGIGGLEFTGSLGTIYNDPKLGGLTLALAGPKQEPKLVPPADPKPCLVARLVAAITGELSREELDADLAAAVDAVAIMEACYQSNRANAWVDVAKV